MDQSLKIQNNKILNHLWLTIKKTVKIHLHQVNRIIHQNKKSPISQILQVKNQYKAKKEKLKNNPKFLVLNQVIVSI